MRKSLTSWIFPIYAVLIGNAIPWKSLAVTVNISKLNHTSFYKAPYRYPTIHQLNRFKIPEGMIITSRPLSFVSDDKDKDKVENSSKQSGLTTSNKESLGYVPGVATVVCKGTSCGQNNHPFANQDTNKKTDGFPGEAIPISDDDQFFSVLLQDSVTPSKTTPIKLNFAPSPTAHAASTSVVRLMTKRPYLKRESSKKKVTAPSRKSILRRSTTPRTASSTNDPLRTRQRTERTTTITTTTTRPSADLSRLPTITYGRPSMFFPAAAAFTIMALPVAAAAVPLLFAAGRKRRSLTSAGRQLSSWESEEWPLSDAYNQGIDKDFQEILRSIGELERRDDQQNWNLQTQRLIRAKQRLQKAKTSGNSIMNKDFLVI